MYCGSKMLSFHAGFGQLFEGFPQVCFLDTLHQGKYRVGSEEDGGRSVQNGYVKQARYTQQVCGAPLGNAPPSMSKRHDADQ